MSNGDLVKNLLSARISAVEQVIYDVFPEKKEFMSEFFAEKFSELQAWTAEQDDLNRENGNVK